MIPSSSRRAACALLLCSAPAYAAPETWVSGVGDDANPCSRTAPCATLQHAHDVVDDAGVIIMLDPVDLLGATLTRAVTVEGAFRGRTLDTAGIIIQAPVDATVVLRNLSLKGDPGVMSVVDGVDVVSAGTVVLEDVTVAGFSGAGVRVSAAMPVTLHVRRGTVMDNAGPGVALGAGAHVLNTTGTMVVRNGTGVLLAEGARGVIRGGALASNTGAAVEVTTTGGVETWVHVEEASVTGNATGLQVDGEGARAHVHRVQVDGNAGGAATTQNGGQVLSWGSNPAVVSSGFDPVDAGPPPDAGEPDAGSPDAGAQDAGMGNTSSGFIASSGMGQVSSSTSTATSAATSSATSAATSAGTSVATSTATSVPASSAMSGVTSAGGSSTAGASSAGAAASTSVASSSGDGGDGGGSDGCACDAQGTPRTPWWLAVLVAWPAWRRRGKRA